MAKHLTKFVLQPSNNPNLFSAPLDEEQIEQLVQQEQLGGTIWVCHMIPFSTTTIKVDWKKGRENFKETTLDDDDAIAETHSADQGSVSLDDAVLQPSSLRAEDTGPIESVAKRRRGRPRKRVSSTGAVSA